jgi:hypothetical protein
MKKLLVLLFSILISNLSVAYSSSFTCSYIYENNSYPLEFERSGNDIYETSTLRKTQHEILYEDAEIMTLGRPTKNEFFGFQLTIINKSTKRLVSAVLLEPSGEEDIISAIVYGSCIL